MTVTVLSPDSEDLDDVSEQWNQWLSSSQVKKEHSRLKNQVATRLNDFANGDQSGTPFDLSGWKGGSAIEKMIPGPMASLALMFEESGKRIIILGDVAPDALLKGLAKIGCDENNPLCVDVLKLPHPGSEKNVKAFTDRLFAHNYVLCGDGTAGQPATSVIDEIYNSRLSADTKCGLEDNEYFTCWFSSAMAHTPAGSKKRKNMQALKKHVEEKVKQSNGRMKSEEVSEHYLTLLL